jgi:hypothetical protein
MGVKRIAKSASLCYWIHWRTRRACQLSIAAHENITVFKVDVSSAFMRIPIVDDVKHKW